MYADRHHLSVYCSGSLRHFVVLLFSSRMRSGQHSTRELNKHILTANLIAHEDLSVYIQHQNETDTTHTLVSNTNDSAAE